MNTKIILYNSERKKSHFTLLRGIRPWGILMAISKGSYQLSFPETGELLQLHPGEVSYIPPNTPFCREVLSPIDFHQFAFHIISDGDSFPTPPAGKLNIPPEQVKATLSAADSLFRFSPNFTQMSEHILHRFLIDYHLFSNSHPAGPSGYSSEILCAISYIADHLQENISIAALAESLHLSHNGLLWKFRKELQLTPSEYIIRCRVERAKQQLLEASLPISQIADSCGFENVYYFSNAFKKRVGISPSEYRKQFTG